MDGPIHSPTRSAAVPVPKPRKGDSRPPRPFSHGILPGLVLAFAVTVLAAPSAPVPAWEKIVPLSGVWKFRSGDSAAWAQPGYPDAGWDSASLMTFAHQELVSRRDFAWFRLQVDLPPGPGSGKSLAIGHLPYTPQEFYWDGVLIGRNGTLGASREEERMGGNLLEEIPSRLTGPGPHLLAIRLSAHNPIVYPFPAGIILGEPAAIELHLMREVMVMTFLAGIFMFGSLYRFLNYRSSGYGRNSFYFSVFVLACASYILLQYLIFVLTLSDSAQFAARLALGVSWYFMVSMIPDFYIFAETFPYRWVGKAQLIAGVFFAAPMTMVFTGILPYHYANRVETANQVFTYCSICISIWVIAWAVWRRQTGSRPALMGILSLLLGVFITYTFDVSWGWAAGVAAHIVFLASAQSLQTAERLRNHRESEIRSARLEIELLKKNIQPHFLLNSLNSIIAWLEEEPKTAVHLVNALADELEILLKVSAEKTIRVDEEIRLCQTHLQVMGLRQDKRYRLDSHGIRGEEHLPPLVLHTLVENGLTHGYAGKSEGVFVLKREDIPGGIRFSLFNDGVPKERRDWKGEKKGEGTGLRYVRSRLEEAFPGRWSLDSRAIADGWQVLLDVRH
ncbi:MAG: regulator [Fibrobacteres bacterium]|nr:regulator [Fibrobacterota bacterium]